MVATARTEQPTCEERVQAALDGRLLDLKCMFRPNETTNGELAEFLDGMGVDTPELADGETWDDYEDSLEDNAREEVYNYGLAFDYVTPGTFDNDAGYWRYQISWGGPSEELRFYSRDRVDFVYLDWFDGADRRLYGDQAETAGALWDWYDEAGILEDERAKAEE